MPFSFATNFSFLMSFFMRHPIQHCCYTVLHYLLFPNKSIVIRQYSGHLKVSTFCDSFGLYYIYSLTQQKRLQYYAVVCVLQKLFRPAVAKQLLP